MAVAYPNPQDPEQACSSATAIERTSILLHHGLGGKDDGDNSQAKNGKFKRPHALVWLWNSCGRGGISSNRRTPCRGATSRTGNTATNVTVLFLSFMLITLSVHRVFSLWATHRKWINAPITYMHRQCPAAHYTTLSKNATLPKICLTTLTDHQSPSKFQRFIRWRNFDGILDLTWQNKQQYADRHGYTLYDGSVHIDPSRPPAWSKVKAMQFLLSPESPHQCDWVMWTDADTVIMNSAIPVTDFLPQDDQHDMLVASDKGGGYNSGVFLFRNTDWSRQWLQQWWSLTGFVRPPGFSLSGDNAALKAILADMHRQHTFDAHVLVPARCTFNSFAKFLTLGQSARIMDRLEEQPWYLSTDYYHKGDFIAHTPGVDNKAEALQLLLQEAT